MAPSAAQVGDEIAAFIKHFNWTRAALVTNSSVTGGAPLRAAAQIACAKANITLALDVDLINLTTNGDSVFQKIRDSARSEIRFTTIGSCVNAYSFKIHNIEISVIIVSVGLDMGAHRDFMLRAYQQNMTGSNYVYIVSVTSLTATNSKMPWDIGDGQDDMVRQAFRQSLVVR